jgi:N-acetylglutamate synthase-like GNAT family acetyltransferase
MNRLSIRPAVASEQKTLEALQWRAALSNPGDREAMLANPDAIELPIEQLVAGQVFVLEQDGEIAGFSVILPREDGQIELDGLFVEPKFWRRGLGRMMVDHCAAVSRVLGSSTLHVIGNLHSKEFYVACGFKAYGVAKTRFGEGLLLVKSL